jgi:hypothetical protein
MQAGGGDAGRCGGIAKALIGAWLVWEMRHAIRR